MTEPLVRLLIETGLVSNAREARRVIAQGAVFLDGGKVTDPFTQPEPGMLVQVGRRRVAVAVGESK